MKLTPLGKATAAALAVIVLGVGVWRFTADRNDVDEPTTAAIKASKAKQSSAASTKKPAAPAKTAASISQELKTQWQKLMNENQEPIEIAVYSKQYNTTVTLNSANDTTHTTASILKVTFLTQLLHQHAQANTTLSGTEQSYAAAAIEHSDNDAATAIYNMIGSASGVNTAFSNLGMTNSTAGTSGWVSTTTTASDQLKLLNMIFYGGN